MPLAFIKCKTYIITESKVAFARALLREAVLKQYNLSIDLAA